MKREVRLKMKRGGKMPFMVDGFCEKDSYGSGEKFITCEIYGVQWLGGGKVKPELIDDDIEQAFIEAVY
jgi:hypothetical protein